MRRIPRLIMCLVMVFFAWTTQEAVAKTVHCAGGDVACVIAAIHAANASGPAMTVIHLAAGTYTLTAVDNTNGPSAHPFPVDCVVQRPNGLPSVTSHVTIRGAGAGATVIARAPTAPLFRILHVAAPGRLTLEGLTITGGNVGSGGCGGGLFNDGEVALTRSTLMASYALVGGGLANAGGQVTIQDSLLVHNASTHMGGGLYTYGGTVTIMQSTLAANAADGGGALNHEGDGEVTIVDSAITDNTAPVGSGGGGISFYGGTLQLVNVTLARNRGGDGGGALTSSGDVILTNCTVVDNSFNPGGSAVGIRTAGTLTLVNTILARNTGAHDQDCQGVLTSAGHNLIDNPTRCPIALQPTDRTGDPGLDAFTDNGQPGGGYYPLLATSPAINAGDPQVCPLKDQLGQPRAGVCDIGAIEFPGKNIAMKR